MALLAVTGEAQEASGESAGFFTGNTELGYGYEHLSSPMIRFSENGGLNRIPGIDRLAGTVVSFAASATAGWRFAEGYSVQLGASLRDKSSSQAPDLAFRLLSVDPMLSLPAFGGSLSTGFSGQQIDVAGQAFRTRSVWHGDWTTELGQGGYASQILEYAGNRHARDFEYLDSRALMLISSYRFNIERGVLEDISLELGGSREENRRGWDKQSNTLWFLRVGTSLDFGKLRVQGSWMHQRARYDAPESPALPARRDRFDLFELSLLYPLAASSNLRLELSSGVNAANSALFDSRMKSAMLVVDYNY